MMRKIDYKKTAIYTVLLLGALGFLVTTRIQASYPLGEKELKGYTLLATQVQPTGCDECDVIEYYWDQANTCTIKLVTSEIKKPHDILTIQDLDLDTWLKRKEGIYHIYPAGTSNRFSAMCYDLENKVPL